MAAVLVWSPSGWVPAGGSLPLPDSLLSAAVWRGSLAASGLVGGFSPVSVGLLTELVGSPSGWVRAGGSLPLPLPSLVGLVWLGWFPESGLPGVFSPPRSLLLLGLSPVWSLVLVGTSVARGPSLPVLVGLSADAGWVRAGGSLLPESSALAGLVWFGWLPVSVLSGVFSPPRSLLPLGLSPPRSPSLPALLLAGFWLLPRSLSLLPRSPSLLPRSPSLLPRSPSLPPRSPSLSPRSPSLSPRPESSFPDSGSLSGPLSESLAAPVCPQS